MEVTRPGACFLLGLVWRMATVRKLWLESKVEETREAACTVVEEVMGWEEREV